MSIKIESEKMKHEIAMALQTILEDQDRSNGLSEMVWEKLFDDLLEELSDEDDAAATAIFNVCYEEIKNTIIEGMQKWL